ncbi:MAG: response regulator, partial [Synergistaceae bacterium]|nr:response regulator [Synergistaceae bacterium]
YEDSSGRLWVCANNGIGYFENGLFRLLDRTLPKNRLQSVQNMIEDYEGNYWFASSHDGLLLWSRAKFRDVFFAFSLLPCSVNAIVEYGDQICAGTDDGILLLNAEGKAIENKLTERFKNVRVRCLLPAPDGTLWICAEESPGVTHYRGESEILPFQTVEGLDSERIRAACLAEDGGLIVGTGSGVSVISGDRVIETYSRNDGLSVPVILNVFQAGGAIYAGSEGGLYKIENGRVTNISETERIGYDSVLCIKPDRENHGLWISTTERLAFVDKSGSRKIDKLGARANGVTDILTVDGDGLWLFSPSGVSLCRRSNLLADAPLEIITLGWPDGLQFPVTPNSRSWLSADGTLYIACTGGIYSISTENIYKNLTTPKIAINDVKADNVLYEAPSGEILIPSDTNRVTVSFSLLSYTSPSQNGMSVFLEGFDTSPTHFVMNRAASVSYTNLSGGRYILRLVGTNRDGTPSEERVLQIVKRLSLTETPLMWILLAWSVIACVIVALKLYGSYQTSQQGKLLRAVNAVAALLISSVQRNRGDVFTKALKILAVSVRADAAVICRNEDGAASDILAGWADKKGAASRAPEQFLDIPLSFQGDTWGYIRFIRHGRRKKGFSAEQRDILASGGLLLASTFMRNEIIKDLIEAKEDALSNARAKGRFLARMSHEIRTPMNAVIGMSELALRDCGKSDVLEYITEIRQAGVTLLSLINDILDFSKMESGSLQINPSQYDISSLLNDVLTIIKVRLMEKPVKLIAAVDPGIPRTLLGDETRVKQILLNLLSNAAKYTHIGHVQFSAGYEREGENSVSLIFSVADTGIGIKEENLKILFEDFARIEENQTKNIEGTGLGLTIARGLCLAMNGDITVKSEYGKGSVFTATIRQEVVDARPLGNFNVSKTVLRTKTEYRRFTAPDVHMLIVDDVPTNLKVMEGLLSPYQMRLTTCSSGLEAIDLIRGGYNKGETFNLVFMDHMMPGMDGIEATKAIRALGDGYFQKLPVIALTANAVSGMREMFLENGFDDFLSKPVEVPKLLKILEKWIPRKERVKASEPANEKVDPLSAAVIEGVDMTEGLARVGGTMNRYLEVLDIFCRDAVSRLDFFREAPEGEGEVKNFTTQAHALKSALANIGASEASELAKELEDAGRAGNMEAIRTNLENFRETLISVVARVRGALLSLREENAPERAKEENGRAESERISSLLEELAKSLAEEDIDA